MFSRAAKAARTPQPNLPHQRCSSRGVIGKAEPDDAHKEPTHEDEFADQTNDMDVSDRHLQEILFRDANVTHQAANQQWNPMHIPSQLTATVNEDKEQYEQLIPETQERHVALQKDGAYSFRALRVSPRQLADNFCYMT